MEPINAKDVTVLWHGWLKKLGGFSKRWKRRYFVFLSTSSGTKELRHYDAQKDVTMLLGSTPKGVLAMTDATGICCFLPPSPSVVAAKKHTMFNLMDSHDASAADVQDQKFVILTPLVSSVDPLCLRLVLTPFFYDQHVHMLAFQSGREWATYEPSHFNHLVHQITNSLVCLTQSASESQNGLSLLASLSAFYPSVDVLHSGMMSKKRERTGHSATKNSIISYWKRHFFVFLSSGDLLYFKDETLDEFQGRVDVRHAPTVRVTGERMLEEKKKELGAMLLKLTKLPGASTSDRENCLVWIATPPSKMFVLKLQEDHEGVSADGRRQELTASAKRWHSLLLQGHAETKYTQLEQCISTEKFDTTPEVISAVRAGIPDELRGAMWKGLSGASDLQRRAEVKRTIRKTFSIRSMSTPINDTSGSQPTRTVFDDLSGPLDPTCLDSPENKLIFSRLCAIAVYEMKSDRRPAPPGDRLTIIGELNYLESSRTPLQAVSGVDDGEDGQSESEASSPASKARAMIGGGTDKVGQHTYPSEAPAPTWEVSARRRLLIATSRFSSFSHPCPWKALCLLMAYLDEDSAFWVINSIQDVYLPGYYHGYRPALQVDVAAFSGILEERAPTLFAHLRELSFPIDKTVERWFLSLFTSTYLPLPTVLRVWDAFFAQGVRILFGVGLALFLRAEDKLFRAKTLADADEILDVTERTSIDADSLFSHALKDDLNITGIPEERFDKLRSRYRQRVIDLVATELGLFKDKLSILSQLQDQISRTRNTAKRLLSATKHGQEQHVQKASPLSPFRGVETRDGAGWDDLESDDSQTSLATSLATLQQHLKYAEEAIALTATELNTQQARWLALSSQLTGCPLSRGSTRLTQDLHSWLLQVKEGKISGAGLDALPNRNSKLVSRLEEQHGFFFGKASGEEYSCLVVYRNDFQSSAQHKTDGFLQALVSTIKAACSVRLECIGSANRSAWHGGRWLQTKITYPVEALNGRAGSSARNLRRSVSNASNPGLSSSTSISRRNPRTLDIDSDQLTSRTSLDDSVLRRTNGTEFMQRPSLILQAMSPVHEHGPHDSVIDSGGVIGGPSIYMDYASTYFGSGPGSLNSPLSSPTAAVNKSSAPWQSQIEDFGAPAHNNRVHLEHETQYQQAEQTIHSAVNSMMSCFSRFIRIESRHPSKSKRALCERALVLEDDLLQELRDVEAIALSTKELF